MISLHDIVAHSHAMLHALDLCRLYARALTPVLLVGGTGTGKSLLARLIHALSGRPDEPVFVTARELDDPLGVDAMAGHIGGAFTGAVRSRAGLLAGAAGSTLVLEDAHRYSRTVQAGLLRLLQDHVYRALGADRELQVRCRFVVCLNEDPEELVRRGRLLPDLRTRYGWCSIFIPPLATRPDDIEPLARHFLTRCPVVTGVEGPAELAPDVILTLETIPWALGNARELEQVIGAAYLNAQGEPWIRFEHLPRDYQVRLRFVRGRPAENRRAIIWGLGRTGGRIEAAAKLIGAHRNTVAPVAREVRPQFQRHTELSERRRA